MSQFKVNVIGAGRVGQTLIRLLDDLDDYFVQDVVSARYQSAQEAARLTGNGRAVEDFSDLRPANLWIISVPDSQISAAAAKLESAFRDRNSDYQSSAAFHCSGYFPAEQMAPLRRLNWRLASAHPVLSFAVPLAAQEQFKGALCGLEGDEEAKKLIQPMLEKMGAECFSIRSESKSLYHAAAVISNNFTVVLQAIAREAWAEAGVSDEVAQQLNAKLLDSTAQNVAAFGPQQALTGPAARGDELVVSEQGDDVASWYPEAGNIYKQMSNMARNLKVHGTTR
ncbi:Rossmann-like and DUF2520 domain-containing protein [Ruegeria lacuscaerulensis]|uniref:Rossmann-like and DUF2520 domain-containing protein n=1 Tax=Ruegeria lacuscaerulensis TaxID=55218 RepID=UPI00147CB2B8|nr:Rossmann-like and DUF2520 domain-containing protein [Ruegeria lacuscaerulensis]